MQCSSSFEARTDCVWNNGTCDEIIVDNYLSFLKAEQLRASQPGDFLWDFSSFAEKSPQSEKEIMSNPVSADISANSSPLSVSIPIAREQKKTPRFVCVIANLGFTTKCIDGATELRVRDGKKVTS
jgi:hypothetical protein